MTQITYTNKNIEFSTTTDIETAINELTNVFNLSNKVSNSHATLIVENLYNNKYVTFRCSCCNKSLISLRKEDRVDIARHLATVKFCSFCGAYFTSINDVTKEKDEDDCPF